LSRIELDEGLAEVVFEHSRTDEQPHADPGLESPSQGEPGPPGERPRANLIEHRDGDSQLFECVDAASLGAQALATEQVGSGELGSGAHSGQAVEP
jgi:hypothetical protein